jgi:CBS-domain-containing membrane protein
VPGRLVDIVAVIRSRAESRDKERHGAQARARQTSTSVYVWLAYAMIHSLPILSRAKRLVGMVSLGDLAVSSGNEMRVGETLKQVSEAVWKQSLYNRRP